MDRLPIEWNPSWDDDWQAQENKLSEEIEEDHPRIPEKAVEFYRYGYASARNQPINEWPDVEKDLYEDYMSGLPAPGAFEGGLETEFRQGIVWAHRGWEAGRR